MRKRPFLKWAGGKYRLLDAILATLPHGARLVEPFAGSAAVFLNAPHTSSLVCDLNADLVSLYCILRDKGEDFIERCAALFTPENNRAERYYSIRGLFNAESDPERRAGMFLYLNRHGYNGLVRYNASGLFNVPFGSYGRVYFPAEEMRAFYRRCLEGRVEFAVSDFREVFAGLRPGDVVYCDPPYLPREGVATFTAYAGKVFSWKDQADLAALAKKAQARGIPVVLSNHNTSEARALYSGADIQSFMVRRFISCKGASRNAAGELLALFA